MKTSNKIGFDLDGIFINLPPLVPPSFIDFLYKGKVLKKGKKKELSYRFPGVIEQKIRILSHQTSFRQPIKENINALKKISNDKNNQTFLVSSRFGFLKEITDKIIDRHNIRKQFKDVYFNYENKQPHIFKEELIKKLKIEKFIDDDLDLALYLADKLPKLKIYLIRNSKKVDEKLPKNVIPIKSLTEFINKNL